MAKLDRGRDSRTGELLRHYFESRARQLLAAADQAVVGHAGLRGSHREDVVRLYLRDVTPRRFEIDRGMIYGIVGRSRECDIVIWDAFNHPSLRMQGHQLFLSHSVKGSIEVKSRWSSQEFSDVREKTRSVRDLIPFGVEDTLDSTILLMQMDIESLKTGVSHEGFLLKPHHIGTAAFFLTGKSQLSPGHLAGCDLGDVDDSWPDVLFCWSRVWL